MIIIQEVLISEEVIEEQFICNLQACKGACCWEGDLGAPLERDELDILEEEYPNIAPFLTEAGRHLIGSKGLYYHYREDHSFATPLLENGACAFLTFDRLGIARCGIEQAHRAGATSFRKPISCHLYPVRVRKAEKTGFDLVNYDRWDICSAACTLGEERQVPVYQFVKEALIRKYGAEFFEELEALALELKKRSKN